MSIRTAIKVTLAVCVGLSGCVVSDDEGQGDANLTAVGAFFLPTGEPDNTSAPTVEIDATGATHAVYPAYAGGNAYYAYCPQGCAGAADVSVVRLATDGTTANAMIALDAAGRPRILLSTFLSVYYASCDASCTDPDAWTTTRILDHASDFEVTGEAFALDPQGRPRFMLHTYVAYLGIGQKPPESFYVACDADCHAPSSWSLHKTADQIWKSSHLRFDAQGRARLATVVTMAGENGAIEQDMAAYVECDGDCTLSERWAGIALAPAFSSEVDAVAIKPTVAMALTKSGAPRVVVMSESAEGTRNIVYFACDEGCAGDAWMGSVLSQDDAIGAGLDLALDANDRPRFVYTFHYNIGLASCDEANCASADATWDLAKVELGSDIPPDEIFLWENCNVGAWFLHSPSIALMSNGAPRVGYQARDISGGWSNPDPTKPACEAGTDMTWSRLALLPPL
jgi:hypothetical protein